MDKRDWDEGWHKRVDELFRKRLTRYENEVIWLSVKLDSRQFVRERDDAQCMIYQFQALDDQRYIIQINLQKDSTQKEKPYVDVREVIGGRSSYKYRINKEHELVGLLNRFFESFKDDHREWVKYFDYFNYLISQGFERTDVRVGSFRLSHKGVNKYGRIYGLSVVIEGNQLQITEMVEFRENNYLTEQVLSTSNINIENKDSQELIRLMKQRLSDYERTAYQIETYIEIQQEQERQFYKIVESSKSSI